VRSARRDMPAAGAPGRTGRRSRPAPVFRALREGGHDGRVSIEANIAEPEKELPGAVEVMRELSA